MVKGKELESVPVAIYGSDRHKQARQNYLKYYNNKFIAILKKIFTRDCETFGY